MRNWTIKLNDRMIRLGIIIGGGCLTLAFHRLTRVPVLSPYALMAPFSPQIQTHGSCSTDAFSLYNLFKHHLHLPAPRC